MIAYGAVWTLRLGGWNSELVALVTLRLGLRGMSTALGEELARVPGA